MLPQKRISEETVLGRNSSYKFEDGYNDKVIEVECALFDREIGLRRQKLRDLAKWLSAQGNLIFDDEPDKYYIAQIYNSIGLGVNRLSDKFSITFICYPFAYSTYVNEYVILDSNVVLYSDIPIGYDLHNNFYITSNQNITVENFGTYEAKPIIEIDGTATNIVFAMEDVAFSLQNISTKTYIDCEKMICYYYDVYGKKQNKLIDFTGNFLTLKPGTNRVSITGADLNCNVFMNYRNTYL